MEVWVLRVTSQHGHNKVMDTSYCHFGDTTIPVTCGLNMYASVNKCESKLGLLLLNKMLLWHKSGLFDLIFVNNIILMFVIWSLILYLYNTNFHLKLTDVIYINTKLTELKLTCFNTKYVSVLFIKTCKGLLRVCLKVHAIQFTTKDDSKTFLLVSIQQSEKYTQE